MNLKVEQINFVQGQRLFITLSDHRNLEGTFNSKSVVRRSIILFNVSFVPSNGKKFSQLEFQENEIEKISPLDEVKSDKLDEIKSQSCSSAPDQSAPECNAQNKLDKILYDKIKKVVDDHIFIDEIDLKFAEAVKELESVEIFAVHGEGVDEGRFGYLTILSVATNRSIFLFDMINLGKKVFKAANFFLKKALESKMFLKVVHNCSLLSDCLKHKYDVKLCNVFDIQACHLVVVKNKTRHRPLSGRLGDIVTEYLHLPSAVCENQITDPYKWRRRPLEEEMIAATAWRVAAIRKLKQPLDDALYAPFDTLCNDYLCVIRDCDDEFEVKKQVQQYKKTGGFPQKVVPSSPAGSDSDSWSS